MCRGFYKKSIQKNVTKKSIFILFKEHKINFYYVGRTEVCQEKHWL